MYSCVTTMISQVNPMLLPERKSVITTLTQHFFSADSRSCISDEADLTLVIAYLPLSIIPINFISPTDALPLPTSSSMLLILSTVTCSQAQLHKQYLSLITPPLACDPYWYN